MMQSIVKKPLHIPLLVSFCLALFAVVFVLRFDKLPPQLPLFYSLTEGDAIIVDSIYILLLPGIMLILLGINTLVARRFMKDAAFVGSILYWVNILFILAFTAIFLKIIFLIS